VGGFGFSCAGYEQTPKITQRRRVRGDSQRRERLNTEGAKLRAQGRRDVSFLKIPGESLLYPISAAPYTAMMALVTRLVSVLFPRWIGALILFAVVGVLPARCQESAPVAAKPAQKSIEGSDKQPELPAQIELLETRVRFEANGDSRKEVHTRVHINNELGARQFARLVFDFNRSFQQIEFPLLRVTHSGGGTADILPSAISDQPNPAVVNAPAYQDVRVKSVRILGLAPNDILEYRVITTTSHHPLASDFWLDHTFDRSGVVAKEVFEVDLPNSRHVSLRVNPATPATSTQTSGDSEATRTTYQWQHDPVDSSNRDHDSSAGPDIALSTLTNWKDFSARFANLLYPKSPATAAVEQKKTELTASAPREEDKLRAIYEFVSQKINTVDLPLGSTGYRTRLPDEILTAGYATPEDKAALLSALARATHFDTFVYLTFSDYVGSSIDSLPSRFQHVLLSVNVGTRGFWLDPGVEVAPFGVISAKFRGKAAFCAYDGPSGDRAMKLSYLPQVPDELPFPSFQNVAVAATLTEAGALSAKVKYILRGDNELLLRVAFHQSPRDKWKEVAQLLALSDGFRGKVTSVTASDPYATKGPFTVEYEITQPKFVDWSKKSVRIPALLPQLGLPIPPPGTTASGIDLGTPLEVETRLALHLPAGTAVRTPTGTSVERDYATFASKYGVSGSSLVTASRHLNFLQREVSAERAVDYHAFVRAVQSDEAQEFTLERGSAASEPATPNNPGKKN
jgi:hypothetical protein